MKKYCEVFRLSFKMQIVWRFDVAMTSVATIARILAAWILWGAVFTSRETVGSFSFNAMLSYYIISSFLSSLNMSNQISGEVSYIIRNGGFSKHMVTPMNPQGFFGFMVLGEAAFHLFFSLAAAILCAFLFRINLTLINNPLLIAYAMAIFSLGLLFMISFEYFLGILAFKFLNVDGFLHIKGNLISFATGMIVPLAILPKPVVSVMRFLPFYYVTYQPAMILAGQSIPDPRVDLIVIVIWAIGFLILTQIIYRHLRIKYDGVGI